MRVGWINQDIKKNKADENLAEKETNNVEKAFNLIFGIFLGVLPLIGVAILGIFIYDYQPNFKGIAVITVMAASTTYIGVKIFQKIYAYGIIEYLTRIQATYSLDNLHPTSDSNIQVRNPADLAHLIATNEHLCKSGTLKIFGDWFGEPYEGKHRIVDAEFDGGSSVLTIFFEDGEILTIWNPEHIHEADSYLKIIAADKVKLEWWDNDSKSPHFKTYEKAKRKINVSTNSPEPRWKTDVSPAQAALVILGKIN